MQHHAPFLQRLELTANQPECPRLAAPPPRVRCDAAGWLRKRRGPIRRL